jgi:hypothetical protein
MGLSTSWMKLIAMMTLLQTVVFPTHEETAGHFLDIFLGRRLLVILEILRKRG